MNFADLGDSEWNKFCFSRLRQQLLYELCTCMRICLHFALSCLSCRTLLTPSCPYTHSLSPHRQPCRWRQCLAGSQLWRGSSLAVPQPSACPTSATFPHRELDFEECPRITEGRPQSAPGLLVWPRYCVVTACCWRGECQGWAAGLGEA